MSTLAAMKSSLFSLLLLFLIQASAQVYESESLIISKVTEKVYWHVTYLSTQSFGRVPCNGMLVIDEGEAIILDTPAEEEAAEELIAWVGEQRESQVKAVVINHFHDDCLGSLNVFHKRNIPSYSSSKTIAFAKAQGYTAPENGFKEELSLAVGQTQITNRFLGEAHTQDNIVSYVEEENVLFGGCMVKGLKWGKGNLADANVSAWPKTIEKVKTRFPEVTRIIPGHGDPGGTELLDYTIRLFQEE